jgi:hypothetical protein
MRSGRLSRWSVCGPGLARQPRYTSLRRLTSTFDWGVLVRQAEVEVLLQIHAVRITMTVSTSMPSGKPVRSVAQGRQITGRQRVGPLHSLAWTQVQLIVE